MKSAILLTVFNRKNETLCGLRSLYRAIEKLGEGFEFDIYVTDDGCTDGTPDAIMSEFSNIIIVKGSGNLYWSGGMRKAWNAAVNSCIDYDFFLWLNDDAHLFENALVLMYEAFNDNHNCIITGAFKDEYGHVSYGGKNRFRQLIEPNGQFQDVFLMNGNLVLIHRNIYNACKNIDAVFTHSLGDWDYGVRARKKGFGVLLTRDFVGITNRHDNVIPDYQKRKYNLWRRLNMLYSKKYNVIADVYFFKRTFGIKPAILRFVDLHLKAIKGGK